MTFLTEGTTDMSEWDLLGIRLSADYADDEDWEEELDEDDWEEDDDDWDDDDDDWDDDDEDDEEDEGWEDFEDFNDDDLDMRAGVGSWH